MALVKPRNPIRIVLKEVSRLLDTIDGKTFYPTVVKDRLAVARVKLLKLGQTWSKIDHFHILDSQVVEPTLHQSHLLRSTGNEPVSRLQRLQQ